MMIQWSRLTGVKDAIEPSDTINQQLKQSVGSELKTTRQIPASLEATANRFLPLPPPYYASARPKQVPTFPIGIETLRLEDKPVGTTWVRRARQDSYLPANIYKALDKDGNTVYKLANNSQVLGFMQVDYHHPDSKDPLHIPLMGAINQNYRGVGEALHALAVQKLQELPKADGIALTNSWGAANFHLRFFPEADISPLPYLEADKINAALHRSMDKGLDRMDLSEHDMESGELGSILAYLPRKTIAEWKTHPDPNLDLFNIKKLEQRGRFPLGQTRLQDTSRKSHLISILKHTDQSGLDIVDFYNGKNRIATMTLNYYMQAASNHFKDSQGYEFPIWSPLARYGKDLFKSHTFIEYWHIPEGIFSEADIQQQLFKIASKISEQKGFEGRVKVELDTEWGEELTPYQSGFQAMTLDSDIREQSPLKSSETLREFIKQNQQETPDNLRALGSFHVHVPRKHAENSFKQFKQKTGDFSPELAD